MVILGELGSTQESPITTSYSDFYASMLKLPYLGNAVPILLPALVVTFALIFAVLSIFKLKNKALSAFQNVSKSTEE